MRRGPTLPLYRERWELGDGDFIDLDWGPPHQGPLVVILHGLEGSSRSGYAMGLLARLDAMGWQGLVMHFRGCSGEPNRLRRGYHAGETGDLALLMAELARRYPQRSRFLVGYSLGGNVVLKWLAEAPLPHLAPQAGVAVSVPFLLEASTQRLERGISRLYQRHLLEAMGRSYRRKFQARNDGPVPIADLPAIRSIREFDDRITAPLHGYRNALDYYQHASSRAYLATIQRPTLIIQARDDPFMWPGVIPEPTELSPRIQLEVHDRGGHVGFVEGSPWRPGFYLERRIPAFLADRESSPGDHRPSAAGGIKVNAGHACGTGPHILGTSDDPGLGPGQGWQPHQP